ncbi:MAG: hypothetical protein AAGC55_27910, partial [Myxococcota bacterium]
ALDHKHYGRDRVAPLMVDSDAEIRRFARAIGRRELVAWGDRALVYQLAASRHREARALAGEALLHIGESDADPRLVPPADWLSAPRVFALAESPIKATREIALTLIRRHYRRLGGASRLGWLMESPDREVRLFAVRLLWDRHRPVDHPSSARTDDAPATDGPDQAAASDSEASIETDIDETASERFESLEALQGFLRTVLFGLPPGRMERREKSGDALPDRPLPASVAKRRLIEVVRDLALENGWFAQVVAPVLDEFVHSQAKGEWHSCVAALAQIRRIHSHLDTALPAPAPAQSP